MIRTVTPNPALDMTYRIAQLKPHDEHRVSSAVTMPGGKGLNTARVLQALQTPAEVVGFIGGREGAELTELTAELGIPSRWVCITGATRRTVALVDEIGATLLNEAGPLVDELDWKRLVSTSVSGLAQRDVLTINGSLPPGSPIDGAANIVTEAQALGAITIVDTSGPALIEAIRAGADLVKPNAAELKDVTGEARLRDGIQALIDWGARAIVVSLGKKGALGRDPDTGDLWHAKLSFEVAGNATGAGDALVAEFARNLVGRRIQPSPGGSLPDPTAASSLAWPEILASAVAVSAAAVAFPTAGSLDPALAQQFRSEVTLELLSEEEIDDLG